MSDVVERWKNHENTPDREGLVALLDEAVAEIERLRKPAKAKAKKES